MNGDVFYKIGKIILTGSCEQYDFGKSSYGKGDCCSPDLGDRRGTFYRTEGIVTVDVAYRMNSIFEERLLRRHEKRFCRTVGGEKWVVAN